MNLDRFMVDCGLAKAEGDLPLDALTVLMEEAEAFLRAGVPYQLWCTLGPESRAAFVEASNRIWRERCAMIGIASQSELHAAMVQDEESGKEMAARAALDKVAADMAAKAVPH